MDPCIITVAPGAAFSWLRGEKTDADLLWRADFAPQAIFAVNLPPGSLRAAVKRVRELHAAGGLFLFGRTSNWPWLANLTRRGALVTFREPSGHVRYLAPPEMLTAWLNSLPGKAPKTPPPPLA